MEELNKFSPEVCAELKYYVYRLIDPRNGNTFYVKPKINYFALYEWIFLIAIYFSNFLLYINIIVTGSTLI